MDTKKLEVLLKAIDSGSLTKAAAESGYTQSGISHMIKALEQEVGFSLLERSKKGVEPTPSALLLLPLIREMVNLDESLQQEIWGIKGIEKGAVTIGSFSSISFHWLPEIIKRFQEEFPYITLRLMEGGMDEIENLFLEKKIDIAFFSRQSHHSYDFVHLVKDPLVAVLPLNHRMAEAKAFPMKDFQKEPFILTAKGFDYDINGVLKKNRIEPLVRFTCMDDLTVISMVSKGLGLSILPKLVLGGHGDKVKGIPLLPEAYRDLGIALPSLKEASPSSRKFVEVAKKIVKEELL